MITLLGATGFIGSHIAQYLESINIYFYKPGRNEDLREKHLGDVVFCIGLTGDAKSKPIETVEAHISKLKYIIKNCQFDSITYCSSTRIYLHNVDASEDCLINVEINDPYELFNLTKLTAESLLINTVKNYKIVRLSNIFGDDFASDNFITSIIKDALIKKKIFLRTTPKSEKDYLHVNDASKLILKIAETKFSNGIYNVAAGINITNSEILDIIQTITGCDVTYQSDAANIIFPRINTVRIKKEFDFSPSYGLLEELPMIIDKFKTNLTNGSFFRQN